MAEYQIYTDGACSPNPGAGGWAFILRSPNRTVATKFGYKADTTNNRMELQAVLEGLQHFINNIATSEDNIVLNSDSKYTIQGIMTWCRGWSRRGWLKKNGDKVLNSYQWNEIFALKQKINLTCVHIRGHTGDLYNEMVDQLAVSARISKT